MPPTKTAPPHCWHHLGRRYASLDIIGAICLAQVPDGPTWFMTIDLPLPALLRNGKTNKHPLYPPFLEAGFLLLLALGYFQQPLFVVDAGIQSTKNTHATRKARGGGRGENDIMSGVYLASLPRKFIRKIAGLATGVWPEADEWLAKNGGVHATRIPPSFSARSSWTIVWKADVFSNEAYHAFAAGRVTAASEEPEDLQIKKVLLPTSGKVVSRGAPTERQRPPAGGPSPVRRPPQREDDPPGLRLARRAAADPDPSDPSPRPVLTVGGSTSARGANLTRQTSTLTRRQGPSTPPANRSGHGPLREWSLGLASEPSIQQLDSAWGAKWRDQNRAAVLQPSPADNQGYPAAACVRPSLLSAVEVEALRMETC
ncbi:hypothetical protein V8E54_001046 [Elaphomyces granulatus]